MLSYPEFRATVQAAVPSLQVNWLNQEQDQAVAAPLHPPTFIVAGPGAGKTTVLVLRALKMMLVDQVPPQGITATTFTRKAANELRSRILSRGYAIMATAIQQATNLERLQWLQNLDINQIETGTLDSLSERFLADCRQPGEIIPATIEGFLAKSLMRRHALFTRDAANPTGRFRNQDLDTLLLNLTLTSNFSNSLSDKLRAIMSMADRVRHDLISLGNYAVVSPGHQVLRDAIADYLAYLEDHHLADFGRLEALVLERLQQHRFGPVVSELRALLVDEFQDTNYLQEQIYLELCRQSNASFTVVGDDDQSIYRFRGATVEIFANFQQRITQALGTGWQPNRVNLFRNYRSTRRVVEFCQHYIQMDADFQGARAPGKVPLIAQASHAAHPTHNVPVLGLFRNTVQELAQHLTQFLWDIFRGQGRQIACADATYNIVSPHGGDFGDSVLLAYSVRERTSNQNNPRDRLPLFLRQEFQARGATVFNPRGQSLGGILSVQRILGLALECIDPNCGVLNAIPATSMTQAARNRMLLWRQAAQQYRATNPPPGGLNQFVQDWIGRQVGQGSSMQNWPNEWPLLELIFTLTTWFPVFQREPEGQVYLEAIARTITEVGQLSSYGARLLRNQGVHDENSVRDAIRAVFEQIATEAVDIDEEIMPYVPRNYFPIMTVHQAKGLEFPLVIVDAGSDYSRNHPAQRRMRCPDVGNEVHVVETDVAPHCQIGPLRTQRNDLQRAWDDIRRLYFVAYSRPENVLLLAGLNAQIRTNPVPCVSLGQLSGGGRGITFVSANQWSTNSPPNTVALI